MKNHKYVEMVSQTILNFNTYEYINDIRELIIINRNEYENYGINSYLNSIIYILENHLSSQNNREDEYNMSYIRFKNSLKKYLFKILDVNNPDIGIKCCKKLICEE